MAGVMGQEVDGSEPDGAGAVGQGGSDSQEGGMGGCMRARWQWGWQWAGVSAQARTRSGVRDR